jgi:hypothetical protein
MPKLCPRCYAPDAIREGDVCPLHNEPLCPFAFELSEEWLTSLSAEILVWKRLSWIDDDSPYFASNEDWDNEEREVALPVGTASEVLADYRKMIRHNAKGGKQREIGDFAFRRQYGYWPQEIILGRAKRHKKMGRPPISTEGPSRKYFLRVAPSLYQALENAGPDAVRAALTRLFLREEA